MGFKFWDEQEEAGRSSDIDHRMKGKFTTD